MNYIFYWMLYMLVDFYLNFLSNLFFIQENPTESPGPMWGVHVYKWDEKPEHPGDLRRQPHHKIK